MGAPSSDHSSAGSEPADANSKKYQDKSRWIASIGPIWVMFGAVHYLLLSLLARRFLHDPAATVLLRQEVPRHVYDRALFVFGTAFAVDLLNCLFERKSTKLDYVILPAYIKGVATTTNLLLRCGYGTLALSSAGRVLVVQRYICWMHTTPTILLVMKLVSKSVSNREAALVILSDEVMLITGALSNLTTGWIRAFFGTVSHLALLPIIPYLHKAFSEAIVALEPQGSSWLLKSIYVLMMVLWNTFGINWDLSELNKISICTEESVYLCCDFTAKILFSSSLMLSSFKSIEQRRERVMRHIEESSKQKLIEELKHLLEQKERFMSSVSHELRTPLNGIIGISEGMLSGCCGVLAEQVRRQIYIIRTSGARLLALINDVMDAAALRQNKLILKQEQIVLRQLVEDVLDLTRSLVDSTVELRNTVPPNLMVLGDTGRIVQILNNLLGNAAKFTRQGYIKVSARYHDSARKVKVIVQDTGIGIPKAKLATIFLPFEQVDMSISRKYGGFGLGLNIVQELVKAHGGEIWVESIESQGSTFTFVLPAVVPKGAIGDGGTELLFLDDGTEVQPPSSRNSLAYASSTRRSMEYSRASSGALEAAENAAHDGTMMAEFGELPYNAAELSALASSKPYADRTHNSHTSRALQRPATNLSVKPFHKEKYNSCRILSVDDDAVNQSVVRSHLLDSGHDVVTINGGSEALLYLTNSDVLPDLILLDCMMPEVDGFEVLARFQQLFPNVHVPVIMVSAHGDEENVVRALDHGADDYITKPFKRGEFLARIQALIGGGLVVSETGGRDQGSSAAAECVILCIDDDEIHQMILQGMLRNQSFRYVRAKTGKDGLGYIKPGVRPPDLILLDCSLPDVSGFEVCKRIRELYTKSQVPIIMLSARHNEKATIEGLNCGANDYVTKPFRRGELLARIRMHLSRKVITVPVVSPSTNTDTPSDRPTDTVTQSTNIPQCLESTTSLSPIRTAVPVLNPPVISPTAVQDAVAMPQQAMEGAGLELQTFDFAGVLVASFLGLQTLAPSLSPAEVPALQQQLAMVFESLCSKYMVVKVDGGPDCLVALALLPNSVSEPAPHPQSMLLPLLEMARELLDSVAGMRLRVPALINVRPQVLVHMGSLACSYQGGRRMFGGDCLHYAQQQASTVPPGCLGATETVATVLHAIGWQHVYLSNPESNVYLVGLPPRAFPTGMASAPLEQIMGLPPSFLASAPVMAPSSYGVPGLSTWGSSTPPLPPGNEGSGPRMAGPPGLIGSSPANGSTTEIVSSGLVDAALLDAVNQQSAMLVRHASGLSGSNTPSAAAAAAAAAGAGGSSQEGLSSLMQAYSGTEQQLVALRAELKSMRRQLKSGQEVAGSQAEASGPPSVSSATQEGAVEQSGSSGSFFKRKFISKMFSRKSKKE